MFRIKPADSMTALKTHSQDINSVIQATSNSVETLLSQARDVLSEGPYDIAGISDGLKSEDNLYYKSTHIPLSIPVLNAVLAGKDSSVIKKIIGKGIPCNDLSKGSCILSLVDNEPGYEIIFPNDKNKSIIYDHDNHLIGGEAISYLLNHIDVEDRITKFIYGACIKAIDFNFRKTLPDARIGEIVKGDGDLWVIDNYYLKVSSPAVITAIKDNLDDVRKSLLGCEDGKGELFPELTALLAFRDDPERFKNMVQKSVYVLPLGFRPTIDKQRDPLSIFYNRLVQAELDLKNILLTSNVKLNVVRMKYVNLYYKYINLVLEKNKYDDDRFKSIMDVITGKEGVIRNNVQSTTIDYSGRSVITVDPSLSVDTIGIPRGMALELCQLGAVREFISPESNKSKALDPRYKDAMTNKACEILKHSYVIAGRQPTLYNLGIQAFRIKIVDGFSIVMNPIVTPAFNADFDGDQMHVNVPQTPESQREAKMLMANVNNIFLPRDGSCHITPRHEMLYGLFKCYNTKAEIGARTYQYSDNNTFLNKICDQLSMQDVHISDKCIIGNKTFETVGKAALKVMLGPDRLQDTRLGVIPITNDPKVDEQCITDSFYKEYFKYIRLNFSVNTYIKTVNQTVQLGFTVANLYPPDINVLKDIDTSDLKDEFEEIIKKREEYYYLGFDTDSSFNLYYSGEYNKLEKKVLERVKEKLGPDNGFIQLIASGARGNKSNLLQLFGMKGTILKNQAEAFTSIIRTPLAQQLGGLEHNITAYGSRQGIIDKVIGTYAPGYLSRKMSHAARHLTIVSEDCGTTDGILFTYDFLRSMYGTSKLVGIDSVDYYTLKDYAAKILESRVIVGGTKALTHNEAEQIFESRIAKFNNVTEEVDRLDGVKMRSPLHCKDQCCCMCYGTDLATNRMVVVGTPIGHLAGPTIGEPVTQLILKNFQKGGVAGVKNLTSSFDALSDLLEMFKVSKGSSKDSPIVHDFISPVEGRITKMDRGDYTSQLSIVDMKGVNKLKEKVIVYSDVKLKDYVKVGESIQYTEGILDINEVLKIRGVDAAQMHMLFNAYNIFVNEVYVNFKYFEVLINGMTFYLCTKSNETFKTSHYYSLKDYTLGNKDGAEFIKVLRGLKQVEKVRDDFFTSIYLEDVGSAMMRNIAVSGEDRLIDPFVRTTLGLKPGIGSDVPGYVESRGI